MFLNKTLLLIVTILLIGCQGDIQRPDGNTPPVSPNINTNINTNIKSIKEANTSTEKVTKADQMPQECTSSTTLKSGEWRLISIPCNPGSFKDIFGKIPAKDLQLYRYVSNQGYQLVNLDEESKEGEGYFVKQTTGKPQTITVSGIQKKHTYKTIASSTKNASWNLLGNPYKSKFDFANAKIFSHSTNEKYSFKKAKELNLVSNTIYTFKNNRYIAINAIESPSKIDPWDGFWMVSIKNNNPNSLMLEMINNPKVATKLFTDQRLHQFYENSTNRTINDARKNGEYFGIYDMKSKGNMLYLGLSADLPAGSDGALLASYNNDTLLPISSIHEQGINSIVDYGKNLAVPGTDPCCGDILSDDGSSGPLGNEWDWGNFYYIDSDTQTITKHRNLPNTVHGWDGWYNQKTHTFYYAGSGFVGKKSDDPTGLLFSTKDFGETWTKVADKHTGIGKYRTYAVLGIENRLYVVYNDAYLGDRGIAKSIDGGKSWKRIFNTNSGIAKIYNVKNKLVFLDLNNKNTISIDKNDKITKYPLPFNINGYGMLAQDNKGYIYAGSDDGYVMQTSNFKNWNQYAKAKNADFTTISYWSEKNMLILGSWGKNANLWKVPLF